MAPINVREILQQNAENDKEKGTEKENLNVNNNRLNENKLSIKKETGAQPVISTFRLLCLIIHMFYLIIENLVYFGKDCVLTTGQSKPYITIGTFQIYQNNHKVK